MRILVCDDREDRGGPLADALDRADIGSVTRLFGADLTTELSALDERARRCIDDRAGGSFVDQPTAFDGVDVAIFDNNLAHLKTTGVRLTAEAVVGQVRAFSTTLYTVSVNKRPDVDFDLSHLIGDQETKADLALNAGHLRDRTPWTGRSEDAKDGFRPWYWPPLGEVSTRRSRQIAFVRDNLDVPAFAALGFDPSGPTFDALSMHAKGFLSPNAGADERAAPDGQSFERLTFRDVFVASGRSLPDQAERQELALRGSPHVDDVIARVVAADVDLWFRRDVIGPQEALVDLPHLLVRMPLFLGDGATSTESWLTALSDPSIALKQESYENYLAPARYEHEMWLPYPAFSWPILKNNEALNDAFYAAIREEWADLVFVEDTSTFMSRAGDGITAPVEFVSDLEGAWGRRYVTKLDDRHYVPLTNFAR